VPFTTIAPHPTASRIVGPDSHLDVTFIIKAKEATPL
jgi:hypothetical protein